MSQSTATTIRRSVYVKVLVTILLTLSMALGSAALLHTPAEAQSVSTGGTPWAWGYNPDGRLGDGTTTVRYAPVQVSGLTGVVALAGGERHSLALKDDGTVWAWGANYYGQLGDGTTTQRLTPVQVSGLSGVIAIAGGGSHSLALKGDGTAWAWGRNSEGQLGDGTTEVRRTPVQVSGLSGVTAIAGGDFHSLAAKGDGTVWSWGHNDLGQLGDGTSGTQRLTPVQVSGLSGVIAVAGGGKFSLALKGDGTVWGWGYNGYGQLGDGTNITRLTPVQVSGLTGMGALAAGQHHSLAVASTCYALSLSHTGSGGNPVASPANSTGCPSGQYVAGEAIGLTASPDAGWQVAGWSGTSNDASTATTNSATMPAGPLAVSVAYSEIQSSLPDLVVTGLSAAESGGGSKSLLVTWTVRNQGSGNASSAWWDHVYLSTDDTLSGDDALQHKVRQRGLSAGAGYEAQVKINVAAVKGTGPLYLIVKTDADNSVAESAENNNVAVIRIR
jgi:hypothetical protein